MSKVKILILALIVSLLIPAPASQVRAANGSATIGAGTIVSIAFETDLVTTVVVTLQDGGGNFQTVRLNLVDAITLGLVTTNVALQTQEATIVDRVDPLIVITAGVVDLITLTDLNTTVTVNLTPSFADVVLDYTTALSGGLVTDDGDGTVTAVDPTTLLEMTLTDMVTGIVNTGMVNTITVSENPDPAIVTVKLDLRPEVVLDLETADFNEFLVIDETKVGTEVVINPSYIIDSASYGKVLSKLGAFFSASLGVDFATLQAYKDAGYGYGVITQACWMATQVGGDASTLEQILAAKLSHDYSAIVLPGGTTPTNWGQFRKAVLTDGKQNLGQIISGKVSTTYTTTVTSNNNGNHGNGNSNNDHGNKDKNGK